MKTVKKWLLWPALVLGLVLTGACDQIRPEDPEYPYKRVLLLYECGFNNLSSYFRGDIRDLCAGTYVPGPKDFQALLVFEHLSNTNLDYATPTDSHLIEIRADKKGNVIRDTVWTIRPATIADPAVMRQVLQYVGEHYKSKHYGLSISGHGTGWMPDDSYNTEPIGDSFIWYGADAAMQQDSSTQEARQSVAPNSFGQERVVNKDYFINMEDLAAAIPFHLDYVLFDACLMGCVEVAYAFRNLADTIGFSQAEVIGDGFIYSTLAERLLKENDPVAAMQDVYDYYIAQTGFNQTAVLSVVDCSWLEPLANTCKQLFERYRPQMETLDADNVQGFFTDNHHWFFDLQDILLQSGMSEAENAQLEQDLERCVRYKAATPKICNKVTVRTHCGLSMYLPACGSEKLHAYYRTLEWNKATGLVQ